MAEGVVFSVKSKQQVGHSLQGSSCDILFNFSKKGRHKGDVTFLFLFTSHVLFEKEKGKSHVMHLADHYPKSYASY